MSTWVEVNGAKVEKDFLDDNIREAKGYDWSETLANYFAHHVHCIICGVTIDPKSHGPIRAYKSKGGCVCVYCYDHFLK